MSNINANIMLNRKLNQRNTVVICNSTPSNGKFVKLKNDILGHKKVYSTLNRENYALITLVIPEGTIVYKSSDGYGCCDHGKCRAEKAIVVKINDVRSDRSLKEAYSLHGSYSKTYEKNKSFIRLGDDKFHFIYHPLTTICPIGKLFSFQEEACAPGIHFFEDRDQAEAYNG